MSSERQRTVLVIDDDPDFLELMRWALEAWHFECVTALDCREGLAALERERDRLEAVLVDYFMPGMEPARCFEALRIAAGPVPVVLCTAAADPAGRAREVGVALWISKPFDLDQLLAILDRRRTG